jgi:hypothetical protein
MRLRERLEIRELADGVYQARADEQYQLQALADVHGEDGLLDWLRFGLPTPGIDAATLDDLLSAGVTAQRYGWLTSGESEDFPPTMTPISPSLMPPAVPPPRGYPRPRDAP